MRMKSAEVADCFRHCKEVVMVEEEAEMRAKWLQMTF